MKKGRCQFKMSLLLTSEEESGFTLSRFAAGIGQSWAFKCQLLPMTKGVNSSKIKLFNTVARLKSDLLKFSHALDQSGQAAIQRWLVPLVLDDGGGRSLFPHGAGMGMSTRTHLYWDPF
jgi:hypothetical protein